MVQARVVRGLLQQLLLAYCSHPAGGRCTAGSCGQYRPQLSLPHGTGMLCTLPEATLCLLHVHFFNPLDLLPRP